MDQSRILDEASAIASFAREKARQADIEASVEEFERSEIRTLRSLARVYRMLQWPPQ
jgi:hypothetical protein